MHLHDLRVSDQDRHQLRNFVRRYQEQKHQVLLAGLARFESVDSDDHTRSDNGQPLLFSRRPRLNSQALVEFAGILCQLMSTHISDDFHKLMPICECNDRSPVLMSGLIGDLVSGDVTSLMALSRSEDIPLELLAFFITYVARPVRQAAIAPGVVGHDEWQLGYCPVCGLWPRMAYINAEDSRRWLWCIGCETEWTFPRLQCPFCLEADHHKLGFLKIEESDGYRIYTCDTCRRYLKTIVNRKTSEADAPSLDEDYLLTARLDVTATFEKYIQDFVGFAAFDLQDNRSFRNYLERARS